MKRPLKKPRARVVSRSPKLPDELHPIVDAVVEIVFERVRSAASQNAKKAAPASRKTAKLNLPLPKQRTALAEALADLLLADLASRARGERARAGAKGRAGSKKKTSAKKTGPVRGASPPKRGRRARV